MKKIMGGKAGDCSMTYKDSNGVYHTEYGSCQSSLSMMPGGTYVSTPYCETASFSGPTALASNGGTSRCGAPTYSNAFS